MSDDRQCSFAACSSAHELDSALERQSGAWQPAESFHAAATIHHSSAAAAWDCRVQIWRLCTLPRGAARAIAPDCRAGCRATRARQGARRGARRRGFCRATRIFCARRRILVARTATSRLQLVRPRTRVLSSPFGAVAPRRGGAPDACCRVGAGDTGVVTTTPGPNFCELGTLGSVILGGWQRRTAGRSQKHAVLGRRPFSSWLHFQARSHVHANSRRCARVDSARRSHACSVLLAAASLADLVPLCRCHREDYGHLSGPKALSLSPRITR